MNQDPLSLWNDGQAKSVLTDLLSNVDSIEPSRRVAVFDNDGTLWTEKPNYTQLDFFIAELASRAETDASLAERAEYRAILQGDKAALGEMGIERVAFALVELFDNSRPHVFDDAVRGFMNNATHPHGMGYNATAYAPMLQLLDALRAVGIEPFIVTGGGTDFVRVFSQEMYGVPPWHVVGTTVEHTVADNDDGWPELRRTSALLGGPNEGDEKIANIRLHLGVRPILAVGNSEGDAAMLEYTTRDPERGVGVLIDHDDPEREYQYTSSAVTVAGEPVLDTAERLGWTVVSMANDWKSVWGDANGSSGT